LLKNQLCFTLKVRSGARTPLEITCDPLQVNDCSVKHNGFAVSASTISRYVIRHVQGLFGSQNKEAAEAVKTSHNTDYAAALDELRKDILLAGLPYSESWADRIYKVIQRLNAEKDRHCA
jgi:hypothetical protein